VDKAGQRNGKPRLEPHAALSAMTEVMNHCSCDWWLQIRICDAGGPSVRARRGFVGRAGEGKQGRARRDEEDREGRDAKEEGQTSK
jgi:hypothetical protein